MDLPAGTGGGSRLALDRSTSFGWYPRSHKPNQNKYRPFNTQLSFHSVLHPSSPFLPTAHSATTLSALVAADPSSPLFPPLPRLGPPSPQHTQPSSTAHSTSTPRHATWLVLYGGFRNHPALTQRRTPGAGHACALAAPPARAK